MEASLSREFPQMFKGGDIGAGPPGWFRLVHQLTAEIYTTAKKRRSSRCRALQYNRVLRRGLAGDVRGLEWFYGKSRMIRKVSISDPVADALLEAEYLPIPDPVPWPRVEQIKEKFGTLRYYITYLPEGLDSAVNLAERLSEYTCQRCGAPGKMREGPWVSVLCDDHYNDSHSQRMHIHESQAKVAT